MRRSAYRRAAAAGASPNRRLLAVGAVVSALGAVVAFTQISNAATNDKPAGSGAGKVVNGQVILTDTCVDSKLPPHTGFQIAPACVSTTFGEIAAEDKDPQLLIVESPPKVRPNTPFRLKISTRNLIRDRFLAAGKGGYYVESSVLQNGLVRGHFHTACRMLANTNEAPESAPVPAFFVATEDSKGSETPDTVTIEVPGLPTAGAAQCASWAGDGSHRVPMMQRANQIPAIDAVRIDVADDAQADDNGGAANGGAANGGAANGGGSNGGGSNGGDNNGAANGGGSDNRSNGGGGDNGSTGGDGSTGGNGSTGGGDNNGGGGGDNGAATAPTTAPADQATTPAADATDQPSTKDDFTPATPKAKPESATKAATTRTTKAATTRSHSSNNNSSSTREPEVTTEAARPTPSSTAALAGNFIYSNEDGVANSGTKAPTVEQLAEPTANNTNLAHTGSNTIAAIGGGVLLLLIGLAIMAFTRRRRPGNGGW